MSEQRFDVKPYGVRYMCDVCGRGEMTYTGELKMTDPPLFVHQCGNPECNDKRSLREKYPTIRWATRYGSDIPQSTDANQRDRGG